MNDLESSTAEATARLAEFVAAADYREMPAAVRERAALITADTIGVCLRGSVEPEIGELHRRLPPGQGATLLRAGFPRVDPMWAAFANATAACFLELDEGCRPSGHPGVHVVPSPLALAQALGRSGPEYLAAMVAGYEVAARISRAFSLRWPVHPHGNMGHAGAVAALGRLSGWSAEQIRQGINAAAGLAGATSWQPCFSGATVRNAYPGLTAQTAFTVRMLVEAGFTGYDAALADTFGTILGDGFDPTALIEGLGERYCVMDSYFKFHAACAVNHPALDAVADALSAAVRSGEYPPMVATAMPEPEQIRKVRVRVAERGARLIGVARPNQLSAKFSIPYAVAAYLVRGNSSPDSFRGDALADPRVWEVAARVELIPDAAFSARWPGEAPAEVEVELEDGRILFGRCSNPFGTNTNPAEVADLKAKFRSITAEVLNSEEQDALWAAALGLADRDDMGGFPTLAGECG